MINDKVRFAVVGCGHIGKRHAAIIATHPEAELAAIVDIRTTEETVAIKYGIPFFSSLDDFLVSEAACDVVCICTPNGLHASQAISVLQSGYHVVIEKPMALLKRDADEIIAVSNAMQRKVFVVMQNRFSPPSVWLKELVNSGKLGRIVLVQLNCYWNRDERYYTPGSWHGDKSLDGGVLYTQFSHFIDLLYWVLGDIDEIHARLQNSTHQHNTDFPDTGTVQFSLVNGGTGTISFTTSVWDKNMESSLVVIGENGSVKVGGQYMDRLEYCHVSGYTKPELSVTSPENDYGGYAGSAQNHQQLINEVIVAIKNKKEPVINPQDGVKVVEIIERIYEADRSRS